jgi:spore maturation protein SpmB
VIPALIAGMLTFGVVRGVRVYEELVEGAKEGFKIAVLIIPYLVAILVAVGMLRSSGALDVIIGVLGPFTELIGLPADALFMALVRPLSGSGASGVMIDAMNQHGPDSLVGYLVSTFQGSTETTFYVLAVYFGAVQVHRIRHTLAAALTADVVGILAAVAAVHWYMAGL